MNPFKRSPADVTQNATAELLKHIGAFPWREGSSDVYGFVAVHDAVEVFVCSMPIDVVAPALHRLNVHDALVNALTVAERALRVPAGENPDRDVEALNVLRAAIDLATGGPQ